jgi:DNA-binding MarR family transcriptional regulator
MSPKRIIDYVFLLKKKCILEEGEIGREVGLSPSEVHGMESLSPGERISGHELSERMDLSPSRGSRVIDHLIAKGLLTREEDPSDRRAVVLFMTEKGSHVRERLEIAKRACEEKITARMKSEQIEQIKQGLELLVNVL